MKKKKGSIQKMEIKKVKLIHVVLNWQHRLLKEYNIYIIIEYLGHCLIINGSWNISARSSSGL